MSAQNLATVFGPNILRPKVEDPLTIMEGKQMTITLCPNQEKNQEPPGWLQPILLQQTKKISETTVSPLMYSDYSLSVKYFLLRRQNFLHVTQHKTVKCFHVSTQYQRNLHGSVWKLADRMGNSVHFAVRLIVINKYLWAWRDSMIPNGRQIWLFIWQCYYLHVCYYSDCKTFHVVSVNNLPLFSSTNLKDWMTFFSHLWSL